jgi:catalase
LKQSSFIPGLGEEFPEPQEAENTQAIITAILNRLKRDYSPGKTLREFHAKMHGCVKATFTVLPALPVRFQYGFLVPGKSYEAWIRFSNGNTKVLDDRKADLRGMAIKLLNVPGEMLINDEALPRSQDFLLVSYPTLMSATVFDFRKNIQAICGGTMAMILFGLNPANWPTIIRTLKSMKKCNSIFRKQYWSVSPFRLGTSEQAVKYSAIPTTEENFEPVKKHKNFLREDLQRHLISKPINFDFMVQLQKDAIKNPLENPCIEWKSGWEKVASIEIPLQHFDTPEQMAFGENLTFSPWHCLKEHQPLGNINRARKAAYLAISKFRLERNRK